MGRDLGQRSAFDASPMYQHKIEPGSIYHLLHQLGDEYLSDDDFSCMYHPCTGRPSQPPSLLAKVLLLQRHDDVSDREAIEKMKFDVRWQYALGLFLDYEGFAHSNLSHFRSRLIIHNMERVPFEKLNQLAVQVGVLKPNAEKAVDSSHIFGAAAVQDTYNLLRSSLRKLLLKLMQEEPELGEEFIKEHGVQRYTSAEKPDIDWTSAEERAKWLRVTVNNAREVLGALDASELATEEVLEAAELLSSILQQDITAPGDDDDPKIKRGVAKDRIISTNDTEMRHGRKSSSQRFDGYKVHIVEDLDTELITEVEVTPGNAHDSEPLPGMMDRQKESLGDTPDRLIGDSHYGTADNRVDLKEMDVEVVAKLPRGTHQNNGRFAKSDFIIEEDRATCPAGHTTQQIYRVRDQKNRRVKKFQFPADVCRECENREQCTTSKSGRSITLHYHQDLIDEIREYNQTEEFREIYNKRAIVERKLSELVWRHRLRFGRYIGKRKIELQATWTAAVANLKRLAKLVPEMFGMSPIRIQNA